MKHMPPKKILVLLRLNIMPGRQELVGILRYMKQRGRNWDIRLKSPVEVTAQAFLSPDAERYDGVISAETQVANAAESLTKSTLPVVSLDAPKELLEIRRKNIVFMKTDNAAIGALAAKHLASKGDFRAYAFVRDANSRPWSLEREAAFRTASGRKIRVFSGGPDENLTGWLATLPRPTAVFAACDRRAAQVMEACREAGIEVPRQLALISVDNDEIYCSFASPSITSIEPDFENEGFRAAEEMDRLLRARQPPAAKTVICPVRRVVERESTTPVSPAAQLIRRALDYISANADKGIGVEDVVAELGVSRRLADLRFRQFQGRTILDTITDQRLAKVKRLLSSTRMSAGAIAEACGFSSPKYLSELFRRRFGTTLRGFRGREHQKNK